MNKVIKLHFVDFSHDFNVYDDHFYKLLKNRFNIKIDEINPDYLIFSCYGKKHLDFDCVKIFYTAENIRPDFNLCDYAIGFDYMSFGDRYVRFPNYARYGSQYESIAKRERLTVEDLKNKTGFCNFIYSNAEADPIRDEFFHELSNYKQVGSPGRHLNNMDFGAGDRYSSSWRNSKVEFQQDYKFTIAFENSSTIGYTTEKILHAFVARTIPIYWGNPNITEEFNADSFINCHDYENFEQIVKRVSQIDNDDDLYLSMINEACFLSAGEIPYELSDNILVDFFGKIFSKPLDKAYLRPRFGTTVLYEQEQRLLTEEISKKAKRGRIKRRIHQMIKKWF